MRLFQNDRKTSLACSSLLALQKSRQLQQTLKHQKEKGTVKWHTASKLKDGESLCVQLTGQQQHIVMMLHANIPWGTLQTG